MSPDRIVRAAAPTLLSYKSSKRKKKKKSKKKKRKKKGKTKPAALNPYVLAGILPI